MVFVFIWLTRITQSKWLLTLYNNLRSFAAQLRTHVNTSKLYVKAATSQLQSKQQQFPGLFKKSLSSEHCWDRRNFNNFVKRWLWQILNYLSLLVYLAYFTHLCLLCGKNDMLFCIWSGKEISIPNSHFFNQFMFFGMPCFTSCCSPLSAPNFQFPCQHLQFVWADIHNFLLVRITLEARK